VLRSILCGSEPWYNNLCKRHATLEETVDRTSAREGLSAAAMQGRLLDLYTRYVQEWDGIQSMVDRWLVSDGEMQAAV